MLDFLVVGAGLAGATFACLAKEHGYSVAVMERQEVGGMCADETMHGINVHKHGAHIFHTSFREIWDFVNRHCLMIPYVNTPKAMNYGRLFSLPINMNTFNEMWGVMTPEAAKRQLQRHLRHYDKIENAEQFLLSTVGEDIYETIFRNYTAKQWGRPCSELSPDIVRRVPIRFTFNNNYFDDTYQGIPYRGYSALIQAMLRGVEVINGEYRLGQTAAKTVIYTGALDELFDYKHGELEYRSLEFDTRYYPDVDSCQGVAVVNDCTAEHSWTRIIEHQHFMWNTASGTVLTYEYPRRYERGAGRYYPVNDAKNQVLYSLYKRELPENVIPIGRLAEYKYLNMDETIAHAMLAFQKWNK